MTLVRGENTGAAWNWIVGAEGSNTGVDGQLLVCGSGDVFLQGKYNVTLVRGEDTGAAQN